MAHSESHANMSVLVLAALWQMPAGPLRGTLWRPGKDRKWDGPKKAAGQAKSRHTLAGPPPADRTRRQLCPLSPAHARALGEATHNPVHRHRPGFRVVFIFTDQSWQQGDTIPVGSGCRRLEELGPRAHPRGPAGAHTPAQRNAQPRGDAALCAGSNGGTERPWKPRAGPRPRTRRALAREDLRGGRGRQSRGRPGAAAPTCRDPAAGTGPPARRGTPGSGG